MKLTVAQIKKFQTKIWNYYRTHGRDFIWRKKITPYYVVVSEIMLQQTQTKRVAEKFPEFIKQFPSFQSLAKASPSTVILAWQGLGYNRRGLFLRELAKKVMSEYSGKLPANPEELITLPGIGKNTAGSVAAFAFNASTVFIETNIRSVYLREFFPNQTEVPDTELIPLIEATLAKENPREWYYALMDYGVFLKKEFGNPSRASKHHIKQSKFIGSRRQMRGEILRGLGVNPLTVQQLEKYLRKLEPERTDQLPIILSELVKEGFIEKIGLKFSLKK